MIPLAYKFIDFAKKKEKIDAKYNIDEKKCQVLMIVVRANIKNVPIKVRNLLDMTQIGSPTTNHKLMKALVADNLLKLGDDPLDNRIKYLYLTPRTLKFFKELSSQM